MQKLIRSVEQIENEIKRYFPTLDISFINSYSKYFPRSDVNFLWASLQNYLLSEELQNIRPKIEETLNTINVTLKEVKDKIPEEEFNNIKSSFEKGDWAEISSLLSKYLPKERISEFKTYVNEFCTHFETIVKDYPKYLEKYTTEQLKLAQSLCAQIPAYHDSITKLVDQLRGVKFVINKNKLLISGLPEIKFLEFKINKNSLLLKTSFLSGEINFEISPQEFVASLASMKSLSLPELTAKPIVRSWKLSIDVKELLELRKYYENFKVYGDIPLSEIFEVLDKNKIPKITFNNETFDALSKPSISSKIHAFSAVTNVPIDVKDIEGSFTALVPFFFSSPEIYEKGPTHSKDQRSFASYCFAGRMDYESTSIPIRWGKIYHRKGSGDLQFSIPGLAGIGVRSLFSMEEIGSIFSAGRKVGPLTLSATSRLGVMRFSYSPANLFVGKCSTEIAKGGSVVLPSLAGRFEVNYRNLSAGCEFTPSVDAKINEDIKLSPKVTLPYFYLTYKVPF